MSDSTPSEATAPASEGPAATPAVSSAAETGPAPAATPKDHSATRSLIGSLLYNGVLPSMVYHYLTKDQGFSEMNALIATSFIPLSGTVFGLVRKRTLDMVSAVYLAAAVIGLAGSLIGGSPQMLLIRDSFVTLGFGLACMVSLVLPRPVMFYFGRQADTGNDPARMAAYDAKWALPEFRHTVRVITLFWGVAELSEFALKVILVYTVSPETVLAVTPFTSNGIQFASMAWTAAYIASVRRKYHSRAQPPAAAPFKAEQVAVQASPDS